MHNFDFHSHLRIVELCLMQKRTFLAVRTKANDEIFSTKAYTSTKKHTFSFGFWGKIKNTSLMSCTHSTLIVIFAKSVPSYTHLYACNLYIQSSKFVGKPCFIPAVFELFKFRFFVTSIPFYWRSSPHDHPKNIILHFDAFYSFWL